MNRTPEATDASAVIEEALFQLNLAISTQNLNVSTNIGRVTSEDTRRISQAFTIMMSTQSARNAFEKALGSVYSSDFENKDGLDNEKNSDDGK